MKMKVEIEFEVDDTEYWADVASAQMEYGLSQEAAEARVRVKLKRAVRTLFKVHGEVTKVAP